MVLRLAGVPGLAGRRNDVLYAPPALRAPAPPRALVYFGGDVQDYPEVMEANRDSRRYLRWNLESTARLLGRSFPAEHIVVVRPSRIEQRSFSCYDNFVPSNEAGVPEHVPTHGALEHLHMLLQEVSDRINAMPEAELLAALDASAVSENVDIEDLHQASASRGPDDSGAQVTEAPLQPLWWRGVALQAAALTLCGFSKGCVVLNQLVHELHHARTRTPGDARAPRLRALCWLDGGHAGARDTWLTARGPLETLATLDVDIFVHVSPYQVRDAARPWIGLEEHSFTTTLVQLGAKVRRFVHEARSPSLHAHFAVVGDFARRQRQPAAD